MELTAEQIAVLEGRLCPVCRKAPVPSNTFMEDFMECPMCGRRARVSDDGKPFGKLSDMAALGMMDCVNEAIKGYVDDKDSDDFIHGLSVATGIPVEHATPYRMSPASMVISLMFLAEFAEVNSKGVKPGLRVIDSRQGDCPVYDDIKIGSQACRGCPEHIVHALRKDGVVTVGCDTNMAYGKFIKGGHNLKTINKAK